MVGKSGLEAGCVAQVIAQPRHQPGLGCRRHRLGSELVGPLMQAGPYVLGAVGASCSLIAGNDGSSGSDPRDPGDPDPFPRAHGL